MSQNNTDSEVPGIRRGKIMVLMIVLVFSAPLILSWGLLKLAGSDSDSKSTSNGFLIEPPRPIEDRDLFEPNSNQIFDRLHGKWTLVAITGAGPCGDECEEALYKMRQIRLAMGEHAPRVQRLLVTSAGGPVLLSDEQLSNYRGQLVLEMDGNEGGAQFLEYFKLAEKESLESTKRLYLIDPLGNLMMMYSPEVDPRGIISDLKHLLRYSRIG